MTPALSVVIPAYNEEHRLAATLADVVKTTVYLSNMNDFATMNEVYEKYFSDAAPARAAVEVSRLPKDALIEIDAILVIPS